MSCVISASSTAGLPPSQMVFLQLANSAKLTVYVFTSARFLYFKYFTRVETWHRNSESYHSKEHVGKCLYLNHTGWTLQRARCKEGPAATKNKQVGDFLLLTKLPIMWAERGKYFAYCCALYCKDPILEVE